MNIGPTGAWLDERPEHRVDKGLEAALCAFFRDRGSVIDIGCGDGRYTLALIIAGVACRGYDGNPHTPQISRGWCKVADFAEPQDLGRFDWALCLEVGEHIPEQYEDAFLDNLEWHATKGVVLSWAVPGQKGHGHANCRDNDYIKAQMAGRGFTSDDEAAQTLRDAVSECYWLRDTIMVFVRGSNPKTIDSMGVKNV